MRSPRGFRNTNASARLRHTRTVYECRARIIDSAVVSALAAALNVILVGVLVAVTWKYANSTDAILQESEKTRLAAEAQATAAQKSVELLLSQLTDQLKLGRGIVNSAVESALTAISYWKQRPITKVAAAPGFPPSTNLVPTNASDAVEHARRISPQLAQDLSSGFDDLRNAANEIERLRRMTPEARGLGFFENTPSRAPQYLDEALAKFERVKNALPADTTIESPT
jgi:hypothetical protein